LRSLADINALIRAVNEFLDKAELWQLYYHLLFRQS